MAMIFTHHYFNKSYRFIPLCLSYLSLSSPGSFLPHRHFPTPHQICRACQGVEVQPPTGIHSPGEGKVGSLPTIILQRFPTSQTVVGIWEFLVAINSTTFGFLFKNLVGFRISAKTGLQDVALPATAWAAWSSAWERSLGSGRHRAKETSSLLSKASHKAACKWSLAMVFASPPKTMSVPSTTRFSGKKNLSFSSKRLTGCYFSTHLKNMLVKMDQFRK